jgi:hypothetical protein
MPKDEIRLDATSDDDKGPDTVDDPNDNPPAQEDDSDDEKDWKALARKWESRARKNKVAADKNRTAAEKLAEIEESQKTESEKQAEKIAELEKKAARAEALETRYNVATKKGVPAELLAGPGDDVEAFADALLKWRGTAPAEKKGSPSPTQGKQPGRTGNMSLDEQITAAHEAGDKDLEKQLKVMKLAYKGQ